MTTKRALIAFTAMFLYAGAATAELEGIKFNGFLTVGATKSDNASDSQDGNITDNFGFEKDTRVGIQLSADVNPDIDITAQLISRARMESYDTELDWGFVRVKVNDSLSVRAGKIKFPTFLISDYFEVGYAYPWIRPPEEVYSSNPISSISGVDLLYRATLGTTDILLQPYIGTSKDSEALVPQEVLPILGKPPGTVTFAKFNAENFIGANISIGTEKWTVRAGHLETLVTMEDFGVFEDRASFSSVGTTLNLKKFIAYAEAFEREIRDAANAAFPNQKGWYVTLGYRFGRFMPHVTLAEIDDNDNPITPTSGTPLKQESVIVGLRTEIGNGAALKIEAQKSEPEAGTRGLFTSVPKDDEVNIYSIAIDVVF